MYFPAIRMSFILRFKRVGEEIKIFNWNFLFLHNSFLLVTTAQKSAYFTFSLCGYMMILQAGKQTIKSKKQSEIKNGKQTAKSKK